MYIYNNNIRGNSVVSFREINNRYKNEFNKVKNLNNNIDAIKLKVDRLENSSVNKTEFNNYKDVINNSLETLKNKSNLNFVNNISVEGNVLRVSLSNGTTSNVLLPYNNGNSTVPPAGTINNELIINNNLKVLMDTELKGDVTIRGNLHVDKDGEFMFKATLSDLNIKENIEKIENSGLIIDSINGYKYRYKGERKTRVGLMAQEIEDVLPEAIVEKDGKLAVVYETLIPVLLEEIKSLRDRVYDLEVGLNDFRGA